jgi:hypothetical protein
MENGKMKRISEMVVQKTLGEGPYGPLAVYSLARSEALFGTDLKIADYTVVEGQTGKYMHILVSALEGQGPAGETGNFVVTTGAAAIVSKLEMIGKDAFPVIGAFTKKAGKAGRIWYDIQ